MVILESKFDRAKNKYRITNIQYSGKPEDPVFPDVVDGEILPNGRSFSMDCTPPYASFKTYTAMCDIGLKDLATELLKDNTRSWITPDYIWAGILNFAKPTAKRVEDPYYQEILNQLRDQIKVDEKIYPYTLDNAAEGLPHNTSPGLPFIITHPGLKKADAYEISKKSIHSYWQRVGTGKPVVPIDDCAGFARSHVGKSTANKVRPTWCMPLMLVTQEARYALPMTREFIKQNCGLNTCYGMEMMKGGMEWLNIQLLEANRKDPGLSVLMTDYSSFDATVPAWLIRDCFKIIQEKFDMTLEVDEQGNTFPINKSEEERKFKKVIDYFINTPVRVSDGRRFLKRHGVPSGSVFTNLIDTCVNFVVSRFLQHRVMGCKAIFDLYFGDDGLMVLPSKSIVDIPKITKVALDVFGLILSPTKSYHTRNLRNVKILGYYNGYGTPIKPAKDLLLSMLYPNKLKDDWSYTVSRALGCLLASAGCNTTVFEVARSIYCNALRTGKVEEGLNLIWRNPRARRHLIQMGCGDIELSPTFFFRQAASIPAYNCTKIQKGINIVKTL